MPALIKTAATLALAGVALAGMSTTANAHSTGNRCAWWHLGGGDALVIDTVDFSDNRSPSTTCKAAKAVGRKYLNTRGWHPRKLRAAGKTWRLIAHDDYNAGDDCANGRRPLGGGPYHSYKSNQYEARTRGGRWYGVTLEYHWPLADQEYCSG